MKYPHWQQAIECELSAMKANHTWLIVCLPLGQHFRICKWIYKVKHHYDGTIEHYKARLVAKGCIQQEGLDYIETFSLVGKVVSVQVLLTLVVSIGIYVLNFVVFNV